MKLSGFVTGIWLVWLLFIIGKLSIHINPTKAWQVSKDCTRALLVIVGSYVARVASDGCSDDANMAFAFAAFAATLAVAVDAAFLADSRHWARPGTVAILSATTIATAETLLRNSAECYSVAAPALVVPALIGVALSSVRKHI